MIGLKKRKEEAIRRMNKLKIRPDAIRFFEKKNVLVAFESFEFVELGNSILMASVLTAEEWNMVKEIEEKWNITVYSVIHSYQEFGELYDLLYVSQHEEEWYMDNEMIADNIVMSYCVNKSIPEFSEFGSIGIENIKGGLRRTS